MPANTRKYPQIAILLDFMDIYGYIYGYMKAPKIDLIPKELTSLIGELDEFKGQWAATQALAPDRLAALRQVATIESVGSSTRIEGVKLTNSEVEALLRGVKIYSFKSRDEQEVAGYAELMEMIFASFKDIPFTENHIKQLHSVLLKHSTKDDRHRGDYKKFANSVEAFGPDGKSKGVIFHTAEPFETPALMTELVEWTNTQITRKELHPLLVIAVFVIVFLHIHPFQDGNGRLSRGLTTLLLLQLGYSYVPYSSFERIIEENKDSYYLALRRGQAELEEINTKTKRKTKIKPGGVNDWLQFFLKSMQKQKVALEMKMKDELAATKMPRLSLQILELIKSRGATSIGEAVAATGANRNTVKLHFRNLVNAGRLEKEGLGRGMRYRMRS
jgi:Fic family protein